MWLMIDPQRGEIWIATLDPTRGAEISKTRPVVILNVPDVGRLPLRLVAPITDWKPSYAGYPWMTLLDQTETNGLVKQSAADAFQVCSLALERFHDCLGRLTDEQTADIAAAVALVVGHV
jgi:mRNA interferase MazF